MLMCVPAHQHHHHADDGSEDRSAALTTAQGGCTVIKKTKITHDPKMCLVSVFLRRPPGPAPPALSNQAAATTADGRRAVCYWPPLSRCTKPCLRSAGSFSMAAFRGSPSSPAAAWMLFTSVSWISSCTLAAGVNACATTAASRRRIDKRKRRNRHTQQQWYVSEEKGAGRLRSRRAAGAGGRLNAEAKNSSSPPTRTKGARAGRTRGGVRIMQS